MGTPEATGLIRLLRVGVVLDWRGVGPERAPQPALPAAAPTGDRHHRLRVATPRHHRPRPDGHGAWSLGWGAVVGSTVTAGLALFWSPLRVRPGWDATCVRGLLRFGLPLAGASLLALLMLNVDYVVVGHMLGPAALGLYLLAFNLCSWPITVVTSAIRRVALALFARLSEHAEDGGRQGFSQVLALVLGVTIPMCTLLAGFAEPLIEMLYGKTMGPCRCGVGTTGGSQSPAGRRRGHLRLPRWKRSHPFDGVAARNLAVGTGSGTCRSGPSSATSAVLPWRTRSSRSSWSPPRLSCCCIGRGSGRAPSRTRLRRVLAGAALMAGGDPRRKVAGGTARRGHADRQPAGACWPMECASCRSGRRRWSCGTFAPKGPRGRGVAQGQAGSAR